MGTKKKGPKLRGKCAIEQKKQGKRKKKSKKLNAGKNDNNTQLGAWRSLRTPSVISPEPRCPPCGIPFSIRAPSDLGILEEIFQAKAILCEFGSGRDRPFQPTPPCYMGLKTVPVLATRHWLYYIQHGVSHDVLTSQLEEYPS
ncbi:hypothetical protein N7447_004924 [Penicillium robsamsonii]|uniref:uncharacterized protein n=1 Tax=Penicillium robsamsonii TaxID=1792511 RepID=UPI00254795A8|nr:uncharacterized protein N7447_004924 [Penicillium robsamsonii]KAJ5822584.1 hypothetical protein N7447_004924 [Penicillium robsamsonii]